MYVRIFMMLSLQMGMAFFAFTNTPRKILAFDLLKVLSAIPHSLRANRAGETLVMLCAAVRLEHWTSYREAGVKCQDGPLE